jgi:hypothetical protein
MTHLQQLLASYRQAAMSGHYFQELIRTYFRYEATSLDLYSDVGSITIEKRRKPKWPRLQSH